MSHIILPFSNCIQKKKVSVVSWQVFSVYAFDLSVSLVTVYMCMYTHAIYLYLVYILL